MSGTLGTINADQKEIPSMLTHTGQKQHGSKALILSCGACCYICREEQGGWERQGGDIAVTPSIRDSDLTASVSCPPCAPFLSAPPEECTKGKLR